ncbi:hypothetical protein [Cerasicoccus frondis]|uniref:hypothetical protein n=1 Tax=Cerasicoccus frondis TaxID=490090 RepID=UPI002852832F|nr:hypothetical protein [Cerasicoccus frondis]
MSNLPGGPADKAGNSYEDLWGVHAIVEILWGNAQSMRVEPPGIDKAEFYVQYAGYKEFWQAKRQKLNATDWSLSALKSSGILDFFKAEASKGNRCVFASSTSAQELKRWSEDARAAASWLEFKEHFLKGSTRQQKFRMLHQLVAYEREEATFGFLQNVYVRISDEILIEDNLLRQLSIKFSGNPKTVLRLLNQLYSESTHKVLDLNSILAYLTENGISLRTLEISASVIDQIDALTNSYVSGQRSKLIGGSLIARSFAGDIVEQIANASVAQSVMIAASAGEGKSAVMLDIVEQLRSRGMPVLSFRLDNLEPSSSTTTLGQSLGLAESPAFVLDKCYPQQDITLVIDQIDCVSSVSGRHPQFFEVLAALANEVKALQHRRCIHLILACRKFDYTYDSRIKSLLPSGQTPIEIPLLSSDDVNQAIAASGGDPKRLSPKQATLLQTAENLATYIDAGLSTSTDEATFNTQTQLYHKYWTLKRVAVMARLNNSLDQWTQVISRLANVMSQREELSVPRSALDEFSPSYVGALESEGVIRQEKNRYSFRHESLFDYCFARSTVNDSVEFIDTLKSSTQELFRRAQLRQILTYLREEDTDRYLKQVRELLADQAIRPHLKILTLELVGNFADTTSDELNIFLPYINGELESKRLRQVNPNKLQSRAWGVFTGSKALFTVAHDEGKLERWLADTSDEVLDAVAGYLSWQTKSHGDRIAGLISPYIERSGNWDHRLLNIMYWVSDSSSRPLFECYLRLISSSKHNGANSNFWNNLYRLMKVNPEWYLEAAARWLDRQLVIALETANSHPTRFNVNRANGAKDVIDSARLCPEAAIDHLVPAIIRVSLALRRTSDNGLDGDTVWSVRWPLDHPRIGDALVIGCENAIQALAEKNPCRLKEAVKYLAQHPIQVANRFLLTAYAALPKYFADEAVQALIDDSRRLFCGYRNSPYWIARTVIERCSPYCDEDKFRMLETLLLEYLPDYEREANAESYKGRASHTLSTALDLTRCSEGGRNAIEGLKEKFGHIVKPPEIITVHSRKSPYTNELLSQYSDEEWLASITKNNKETVPYFTNDSNEVDAYDFSGQMREFAKKEPQRFAQIALRFSENTPQCYYRDILYALREVEVEDGLKMDVARLVFGLSSTSCIMAALDLLGTLNTYPLPDDVEEFISGMALEHSDPDESRMENLTSVALNSVRGHALSAIGYLIRNNHSHFQNFETTITSSVNDSHLAVRIAALDTLFAIALTDQSWAVNSFIHLLNTDERIFKGHRIETFIRYGLDEHISAFSPIIRRMLATTNDDVNQAAGRLACLARLHHDDMDTLAQVAINGNEHCRFGAAQVAASNVTSQDCRNWCETTLSTLFHDKAATVRQQAAACFRELWKNPELDLRKFEQLIQRFIQSPALATDPSFLLHALEETQQTMPICSLDVCEAFVLQCAEQARDISTSIAVDESRVGKILFKAYSQLNGQPERTRALDIIDAMCLEGLSSVKGHLAEIER